ncbi:MAG: flavin reductase family protein [Anaerolineales bacterium]
MEINPADIAGNALNRILLGSVVPRPIAWVSTINEQGQPNLAPFSFFNAVCTRPPTLLFCPGVRGLDGASKDTLRNIRTGGEYVINVVTEATAEAMNKTATELPPEVNEFEFAGLTQAASIKVKPPRVAESPVNFECQLRQIVDIGDGLPGSGWIVIGEIVHLHVSDDVLLPDYKIDIGALQPVGRLAGYGYAHITDTFEMKRLPPQIPTRKP